VELTVTEAIGPWIQMHPPTACGNAFFKAN
jgi:hypothetical protein